jgi:hypothetical protein
LFRRVPFFNLNLQHVQRYSQVQRHVKYQSSITIQNFRQTPKVPRRASRRRFARKNCNEPLVGRVVHQRCSGMEHILCSIPEHSALLESHTRKKLVRYLVKRECPAPLDKRARDRRPSRPVQEVSQDRLPGWQGRTKQKLYFL